jgi:hypothetical protein
MGGTALWAALLHGFEGFLWAAACRVLGALKDNRSAVRYSLGAMTIYGHSNISTGPGGRPEEADFSPLLAKSGITLGNRSGFAANPRKGGSVSFDNTLPFAFARECRVEVQKGFSIVA